MSPAPLPPGACSPGALSRRAFLGGALGAAGGLVVAGRGGRCLGRRPSTPDPKTFFPLVLSSDLARVVAAAAAGVRALAQHGKGIEYASGPSVTVRFRKKGGRVVAAAEARVRPRRPPQGSRRLRGPAGARQRGGLAGRGARAGSEGAVHDPGRPTSPTAVVPGQAAPRDPSPTTTDTLGVDPICTRDPDVPAAHAVAVDGDRRGQAGGRVVRHAGAVPVAVLRAGARRVPRHHQGLRRPDRAGAHRDLQEAHRHRARADGRGVAPPERAVAVRDRRATAPCSRASTARSAAPR